MKLLFVGLAAGFVIGAAGVAIASRTPSNHTATARTVYLHAGDSAVFNGTGWRCYYGRLPDPVGVLGNKSAVNSGRAHIVCSYRMADGPCDFIGLTNPYLWVATPTRLMPTGTGAWWARTRIGCKTDWVAD